MDCLIFRLAAIEDAGLVQAIRARAYIPAYTAVIGVAPKPAFEDYRPRIERGEVWMAALGTEPVGILVMEDAPNHMLIYSVAVEPSHQGKGLAKAIVGQAERIARGKGKPELRLYTNQKMRANLRLYSNCGFSELRRRPHPSRDSDPKHGPDRDLINDLEPVELNDRQHWFLARVSEGGRCGAKEIMVVWEVSLKTARRDIQGLQRARLLE